MDKTIEADVLVVGAGPVGLTLAMDLQSRGVRVAVAEVRPFDQVPSVKCNHVSARTMEVFRRLGVARQLRDAGLPPDYPNDVAFRTTVLGRELTRIPIPARQERYTATGGPDTWWPTPEPPHRINQLFLEPILRRHAAALPGITFFHETQVVALAQEQGRVVTEARDLRSGGAVRFVTRYVAGCDGGSSTVRRQIGGKLQGTDVIQQVQSTFIRAPSLRGMLPGKPAWCYYAVNPRRCGTVFAIDGRETWLVHNHLNASEPGFDSVDRDASIRHILGVDERFEYEVISKEDWVGRRLVADKLRQGNVFIAGDAAHLWVPYAGYGMNAGIADAVNLAWVLAARVQGWGGEGILDAYEAERLPITEQVSRFAMNHAQQMIKARSAVPPDIEAEGEEGERQRAAVGEEAYRLNVQQFCCAGLNFGYFYTGSPIIAEGDDAPPPYTMGDFAPSTAPGCRAPHFRLRDGRSLYDLFGPGYTLLRFDSRADVQSLAAGAAARGIPLAVLDLEAEERPEAYRHGLVLCRSDQHVAWRGHGIGDAGAQGLLDMMCGRARTG